MTYNAQHRTASDVASQLYQAFGCVPVECLPDGEWERIMDWISSVASDEPVSDLLPVSCHSWLFIDDDNTTVSVDAYLAKLMRGIGPKYDMALTYAQEQIASGMPEKKACVIAACYAAESKQS